MSPTRSRSLADEIRRSTDRIDVLIHNAGALSDTRRTNSKGVEATVASQVIGPVPADDAVARRARPSVTWPGGHRLVGRDVHRRRRPSSTCRWAWRSTAGSEQYARAKRAQVTLNELWARHVPSTDVVFHAMHPGWADTPGVRDRAPEISARSPGPLLRSPEQGADTVVWLACDERCRTARPGRSGSIAGRGDPSLAPHPPLGHGAATGTPVGLVRRAAAASIRDDADDAGAAVRRRPDRDRRLGDRRADLCPCARPDTTTSCCSRPTVVSAVTPTRSTSTMPLAGRLARRHGLHRAQRPHLPNLVALFDELGVETFDTTMSFAVTDRDPGSPTLGLTYRASSPNSLFADRRNVVTSGDLADVARHCPLLPGGQRVPGRLPTTRPRSPSCSPDGDTRASSSIST